MLVRRRIHQRQMRPGRMLNAPGRYGPPEKHRPEKPGGGRPANVAFQDVEKSGQTAERPAGEGQFFVNCPPSAKAGAAGETIAAFACQEEEDQQRRKARRIAGAKKRSSAPGGAWHSGYEPTRARPHLQKRGSGGACECRTKRTDHPTVEGGVAAAVGCPAHPEEA